MKTIYLASGYGFTEAGDLFLREVLLPGLLGCGIGVLDPWRHKEDASRRFAEMDGDLGRMRALNAELARNNAEDIRRSDAVVACLDGPDVDSGVAAEVGYAFALGKTIHGLRADFRVSGDNIATTINLQVQYFIEASGGTIHETAQDLLEYLGKTYGKPGAAGPAGATG